VTFSPLSIDVDDDEREEKRRSLATFPLKISHLSSLFS
jgi:hypothetical protein